MSEINDSRWRYTASPELVMRLIQGTHDRAGWHAAMAELWRWIGDAEFAKADR